MLRAIWNSSVYRNYSAASAAGAIVDRHVEIELQVGVGQYDCADVAPGHDHGAAGRKLAVLLVEDSASPADGGNARDVGIHTGLLDGLGHVLAIEQHRVLVVLRDNVED